MGGSSPTDGISAKDTGWLLANAREHAADPDLRTAAGFARSGPRPPVHRSQVGRWESGHTPATYAVMRRYEETLGLPCGQLTAAVDFMARRQEPLRVQPALPRPLSEGWAHATIDLVEKAVSDERMTGADWDELSALLAAHPEALLRGPDWERLISRVSLETATTIGLEYSLRAEASARLAGHPRSACHVAGLARQALSDPGTQVFETVSIMQYCSDPVGVEMLVRHLQDPTMTESAVWSALLVLSALARGNRLETRHRAAAGEVALDLLRDPDQPLRAHRSAATFLGAIDPPTRAQIVSALRAGSRSRIARIVQEGTALADDEVAESTRHVERRLALQFGPRPQWAPQLSDLVHTATQSSHLDARGLALEVLLLLPQGRAVGLACADELRDALASRATVLADDLLARLSWLLQPEDLPTLLELALDSDVDVVTAQQAAMAIGNARPPDRAGQVTSSTGQATLSAEVVASRVAVAARRHIVGGGVRDDVARGPLYVLGMYGRFDVLGELFHLAARHEATGWRGGLVWWLDLPGWARPVEPARPPQG